jgi:hypothetical protein
MNKTIKGWQLMNKETFNLLSQPYETKEYAQEINDGDSDYEPVEVTITYKINQ